MMLTLLTVSGVTLGLAAVCVLAAKGRQAALAGSDTVVGLGDASADTLAEGGRVAPVSRTDWHLTTVAALSDAEELLDVLECQGYSERELIVLGNACFTVRWR